MRHPGAPFLPLDDPLDCGHLHQPKARGQVGSALHLQQRRARITDFFPGFGPRRIATSGAEINLVTGGSGPPRLLLHGYL